MHVYNPAGRLPGQTRVKFYWAAPESHGKKTVTFNNLSTAWDFMHALERRALERGDVELWARVLHEELDDEWLKPAHPEDVCVALQIRPGSSLSYTWL